MKYYLEKRYAYKEYGDLGILFAKTNNPDSEFFELNSFGKMIIGIVIRNNGATQEEIIDYLFQGSCILKDESKEEIIEFLDMLIKKDVLYIDK